MVSVGRYQTKQNYSSSNKYRVPAEVKMRVEELLNPEPKQQEEGEKLGQSVVTQLPTLAQQQSPMPPVHKSRPSRLAKDAPVFRKGPTTGEVLFPPHEAEDDEEIVKQHEIYQIFPRGEISQHCHHIPYSSDKKTFLSKTGRDAFEVFQYTFKLPGEDREYVVMWDYNIGLVRITPFFKCCKYSKTTPAKALNVNPGLRDVSHSITGGALTAQGYWMPFACAKAVTATFCYSIRYALTPIFGKGFLDTCLNPSDPRFGNFRISTAIIQGCNTETQRWLQRADARVTPASSRDTSEAPSTPKVGSVLAQWQKLKPKLVENVSSPESGYGTETDWSDNSPKTTWATVNGHKLKPFVLSSSTRDSEANAAEGLLLLSSPTSGTHGEREIPRSVAASTPPVGKKENAKRTLQDTDEDSVERPAVNNEEEDNNVSSPDAEGKILRPTDSRVAYTLLQLRCQDGHREKRPRFRSLPSEIP